MNCLIIAAGYGSRLRAMSESKPLTPIGGTPLVEHVVRRAMAGGARSFVVVTGHRADQVETFLDSLGRRLAVSITCRRTEDWARPNGHSVITGSEGMDEPYLLLMADHLFDPAIVARLSATGIPDCAVRLAVDRDLANPAVDLDDVTKVEVDEDGRILHIGKALATFNAFDTGIFLAGPQLREALLEQVAGGGGGSLSEGIQHLADRGRAATMDVAGAWWFDVDEPDALRHAEAQLATAAQG